MKSNEKRSRIYSTSLGIVAFRLPRALTEGGGINSMEGEVEVSTHGEWIGDCTSSDRGKVAESSCDSAPKSLINR